MDKILNEHMQKEQTRPSREHTHARHASNGKTEPLVVSPLTGQTGGWDSDSDEPNDEGSVEVMTPEGETLRFTSFSAAAMSSRVPKNSTIKLPAGIHKWPGGDLSVSIEGSGPESIIYGNEGSGYFFYLRSDNIHIRDVTLHGHSTGRAHVYIDRLRGVSLEGVTFRGAYNHCVQIVESGDISVESCVCHDAQQPAVHCSNETRRVVLRSLLFQASCSAPAIAAYNSDISVYTCCLKSTTTSIFQIYSKQSKVSQSDNTVTFLEGG